MLIDLEVAGQNRIVHVGALRDDVEFEQRNGFGIPDGRPGLTGSVKVRNLFWATIF